MDTQILQAAERVMAWNRAHFHPASRFAEGDAGSTGEGEFVARPQTWVFEPSDDAENAESANGTQR